MKLFLMAASAACLVSTLADAAEVTAPQMIEAFEGTAIFISHDRYFLDRMADRVVEVRDGAAQSWIGGYSEWLLRRTDMATPLAAGGSIRE